MKNKIYATPEYMTASDIKRIRKKMKYTQRELAELLGCSKPTVERWETSSKPITGPEVLALYLLERETELIEEIRIPDKTYPLRLLYMYKQMLCTVIDIDEVLRKVHICNYTDNILFRAFGINEEPTYEQYLEFLESRCFPKNRDKMKLILKDLELPFYDPFLIIEKTEGRMAEDDFWIQIER